MQTSYFTKLRGLWRPVVSGLVIGLALVAGGVWASYIPAPSSAGPGNNAATPIYNDTTTQSTTNLGIKRDTTAVYDFAVNGLSYIENTLISQQNIIFDGGVTQENTSSSNPINLDIQGNLFAMGAVSDPGNILDEALSDNNPDYTLSQIDSFTASDPVCATQAGVIVRCLGCTDPTATNYDPAASTDDGTCNIAPVPGCMDSAATNYNPNATSDDGSCEYPDVILENTNHGLAAFEKLYNVLPLTYNQSIDDLQGAGYLPNPIYTHQDLYNTQYFSYSQIVNGHIPQIRSPRVIQNAEGICAGCIGSNNTTFTVPSGVYTINLLAVGAGGAGGGRWATVKEAPFNGNTPPQKFVVGGSGGSGSKVHLENIPVTAGDVITVSVGTGGLDVNNQNGNGASTTINIPGTGTITLPGGMRGGLASAQFCNANAGLPAGGAGAASPTVSSGLLPYVVQSSGGVAGKPGVRSQSGSGACQWCGGAGTQFYPACANPSIPTGGNTSISGDSSISSGSFSISTRGALGTKANHLQPDAPNASLFGSAINFNLGDMPPERGDEASHGHVIISW